MFGTNTAVTAAGKNDSCLVELLQNQCNDVSYLPISSSLIVTVAVSAPLSTAALTVLVVRTTSNISLGSAMTSLTMSTWMHSLGWDRLRVTVIACGSKSAVAKNVVSS